MTKHRRIDWRREQKILDAKEDESTMDERQMMQKDDSRYDWDSVLQVVMMTTRYNQIELRGKVSVGLSLLLL